MKPCFRRERTFTETQYVEMANKVRLASYVEAGRLLADFAADPKHAHLKKGVLAAVALLIGKYDQIDAEPMSRP